MSEPGRAPKRLDALRQRVDVLACGGRARTPLPPRVPTLIEENVREVEVFAFQGLLGPAGMPAAAVQRLNGELNKALGDTAVLKRFLDFGMETMQGTPEQFRAFARAESKRWGRSFATTASRWIESGRRSIRSETGQMTALCRRTSATERAEVLAAAPNERPL